MKSLDVIKSKLNNYDDVVGEDNVYSVNKPYGSMMPLATGARLRG